MKKDNRESLSKFNNFKDDLTVTLYFGLVRLQLEIQGRSWYKFQIIACSPVSFENYYHWHRSKATCINGWHNLVSYYFNFQNNYRPSFNNKTTFV